MNEISTALGAASSNAIQSKSDLNTESKTTATNNVQKASDSDKKDDEVNSKIEQFKKKKSVMNKIEKLNQKKITLKAKLDRVNSKLAELLKQV